MPRVLLVEDEPSASRYLRSLIESRCGGFEVVDSAENGAEALEKIPRTLPDIVITDIKMPVMDGIDLAGRIAREHPSVYTVIVSGYQEFEYARRALHSGVVEYLLKPVTPRQLRELLASLQARLTVDYHDMRVTLLAAAVTGSLPQPLHAARFLPFPRYAAAVLRCGGLPSRRRAPCVSHDLPAVLASRRNVFLKQDIWPVPGRDAEEIFLFHAPGLTRAELFRQEARALFEEVRAAAPTVLFSRADFPLDGVAEAASGLLRVLDAGIVLGLPRCLEDDAPPYGGASALDPTTLSRIDYLVSNAMFGDLEAEIGALIQAWERERRPQIQVEAALRRVFSLLARKAPAAADDLELLIDDALRQASSMEDLARTAWGFAARLLQCPGSPRHGEPAPALLDHVQRHVRARYAEPLSLRSVCEAFGVSQSYLSRLFRRAMDTSFNDFLTHVRIEAAQRLMRENAAMPIKDVAVFVGYRDQFYFSRVFKSVTGMSPSEFAGRAT